VRFRDKVLASTDVVGSIAGIPVVAQAVNAINKTETGRKLLDATLGVAVDAPVPDYHSNSARKQLAGRELAAPATPTAETRGKVVLFTTCYGNRNEPDLNVDLVEVFEHNGIPVKIVSQEKCCGMPKLELGDLEAVARHKETNIPALKQAIDEGYDIVAPIPSCVLMFKQELPLMFPEDAAVQAVKARIFDPFEYLMHRHKAGLLRTDFTQALGKVAYQVACHQRVQNIGLKTREVLSLIPGTEVKAIERCSGHDGTYAVRKETHDRSMKIVKPVVNQVKQFDPASLTSDCPMAGAHIAHAMGQEEQPAHPLSLLRRAYGI
jgi:Fe-S oxidoreductase